MRNGFVRGMLVGTVVGAASSFLMNPRHREKAREMIEQGGQLIKGAEDNIVTAGSFIEKSRHLFQDEPQMESMVQTETGGITDRVALLEKRLEELEHKGV